MLTAQQQEAQKQFYQFLLDPVEQCFILKGFAGTGKSYLVKTLLNEMSNFFQTARLIDPIVKQLPVLLTATTNKAAEALSSLAGEEVITIHSATGLKVGRNDQGLNELVVRRGAASVHNTLIIIDEASYIDSRLLDLIFKQTQDCKLVFIGDPAQLTPVRQESVVFKMPWTTAALTEVVRQTKGSQITDISAMFRDAVTSGVFVPFTPNNSEVFSLSKEDFKAAIDAEFSRSDWHHNDSKILAWSNSKVIQYNHYIKEQITQSPVLNVGDYAIVNHYVPGYTKSFKTDETVLITSISDEVEELGYKGKFYSIGSMDKFFMLTDIKDIKRANKQYLNTRHADRIERTWIDLRAQYACTIHKSQGSTYDKVFIDLNDIRKCGSIEMMARLLYVAVSRARHKVYFYGDFI